MEEEGGRMWQSVMGEVRNASFIHPSLAVKPFVGPWPLFEFRNPIHSQKDSLGSGSASRKAAAYTQDSTNTQ
jgi:hypothetical protein